MNWQSLVDSVMKVSPTGANVVLFSSKPVDKAVGKNLIPLANDLAGKGINVAFIVSKGACARCDEPTIYSFDGNGKWSSMPIQDPSTLVANLPNLNTLDNAFVYPILTDANLDIQSVGQPYQIRNKSLNAARLQQVPASKTSSSFWIWILIIILILLLLWAIFRDKKTYA